MTTMPPSLAPQSPLFADRYLQIYAQDPNATFCWTVEADKTPLPCTPRSRQRLLEDATGVALYFQEHCLPRRRPGDPPVVVSILSRSSYESYITFVGVLLNRWTPVLISPRASTETIVSLLQGSHSRCLVVDKVHEDLLVTIREQLPRVICTTICTGTPNHGFVQSMATWSWSVEDGTRDLESPAYYLHSSGSTATPKLISVTHSRWADLLTRQTRYPGRVIVTPLPMFHAAGLATLVKWPFGSGNEPVIIESLQPITGELFCRVLDQFHNPICSIPPSLLEEIASGDSKGVQSLTRAHRVIFAGAALSPQIGDQLARAGVKLVSGFGSTETEQLTVMNVASDDPLEWQYVRFLDPGQLHFVTVPGSEDLFRLVIKPGRFISVDMVNCQDPCGFEPGDLFQKHLSKPDLWKHMGRRGSMIVLSNGEKTDTDHLESLIAKDPAIERVVVFGEGRFQNGVILWPCKSLWDSNEIFKGIWPMIEHVNSIVPQHSCLVRELVLVAECDRPFVLTDKLTVRRKETLALYEAEIEAAYAKLESGDVIPVSEGLPSPDDYEGTMAFIRSVVWHLLGKDVGDNTNLFECGMDSLSAGSCRSYLIPLSKVMRGGNDVRRNLLYHYPTISSLAEYMTTDAPQNFDGLTRLQELLGVALEKLSDLPFSPHIERSVGPNQQDHCLVILLTGSTGSFGSQILTTLLHCANVQHIFCLNRSHPSLTSRERQRINMDDPIILETYLSKTTFLEGHINKPGFGLGDVAFTQIRSNVTHIIHCAWNVNFNHTLDYFFDVDILGVPNVIEVCLSTRKASMPRIYFLSSVSAVANYGGREESVPEMTLSDFSLPLRQGYAQSKYIAEQVLSKASEDRGIPVTIIRVGQLSGSTTTGAWNKHEYIPILLRSCATMGQVPNSIPACRWTPTDVAARILLDILLHDKESHSGRVLVRHIDNLQVIQGPTLVDWLIKASNESIRSVPGEEWLQSANTIGKDIPAQRLADFYQRWLKESDASSSIALSMDITQKLINGSTQFLVTPELVGKYYRFATGLEL